MRGEGGNRRTRKNVPTVGPAYSVPRRGLNSRPFTAAMTSECFNHYMPPGALLNSQMYGGKGRCGMEDANEKDSCFFNSRQVDLQ